MKAYRHTVGRRVLNRIVRLLLLVDLVPGPRYLLTVEGRNSGLPRSTPVTLVEQGGARWLVAPYGEVGWVKNARAAGRVELSRGRRTDAARVRELDPEEAAPVLKMYAERVPHARTYLGAPPSSPPEAFPPDARRCPVFRLLGDGPEVRTEKRRERIVGAALYYHFEGKRGLLREVLRTHLPDLKSDLAYYRGRAPLASWQGGSDERSVARTRFGWPACAG